MLGNRLDLYRRGSMVRRYHTCTTINTDTVGRHSAGVAFLCWELTGGACRAELMMAAIIHDVAEAEMGDIPAPTKRAINNLGALESDIMSKAGMPDISLTIDEQRILKLADCIEGMWFCATEIGMGNLTMTSVYVRYREYAVDLARTDNERQVYWMIRHSAESIIDR